jgi:IS5 family transposase
MFIDATFFMAKGGGAEVGATKRGKGMKIMAIVDRHGLPLSVSTHAANHHEVRLVQLCFDFSMIEAKPENLIGDRAYDSDPLDTELRRDGIEMIAPHRSNRSKPPTQDHRRLRRYTRRRLVERFFAWIQRQSISSKAGCSSLAAEKHGAAKGRVMTTAYAQRGPAARAYFLGRVHTAKSPPLRMMRASSGAKLSILWIHLLGGLG